MAEDDGECAFRVFARQCVCICSLVSALCPPLNGTHGLRVTGVTDAGVVDLNSDFVCSGRSDLYILDREVFCSFPSYCCLGRISLSAFSSTVDVVSEIDFTLQVIVCSRGGSQSMT